MRRRALVGIFATMLFLLSVLFSLRHIRLATLSPAALALKHIDTPPGWADDCSRLLRTAREAIRESSQRPSRNTAPLSPDEIAIYRAILQQWNANGRTSLNLSNRTFPLDATSSASRISDCECLKGIDVQSLVSASHSFHAMTRDVFPERNIRLVDANQQVTTIQNNDPNNWIGRGKPVENAVNDALATGLFSMSEIAFDREHRRAVVSHSFVCGTLCGSGGAWLFEKVDGVWRKTDRVCGGWISQFLRQADSAVAAHCG